MLVRPVDESSQRHWQRYLATITIWAIDRERDAWTKVVRVIVNCYSLINTRISLVALPEEVGGTLFQWEFDHSGLLNGLIYKAERNMYGRCKRTCEVTNSVLKQFAQPRELNYMARTLGGTLG